MSYSIEWPSEAIDFLVSHLSRPRAYPFSGPRGRYAGQQALRVILRVPDFPSPASRPRDKASWIPERLRGQLMRSRDDEEFRKL